MVITGRVVGDPREEAWEDRDSNTRIARSLDVVDDTLRTVVTVTFAEKDDAGWADAAALRDGEPVRIEATRMIPDKYGRQPKIYGRVLGRQREATAA